MYKPLKNFSVNKPGLISFYYKNKESIMKKYSWQNSEEKSWSKNDKFKNQIKVERPYYVSKNLTYEGYHEFFSSFLPSIKCLSYEFVHMPSNYDMDVHVDNQRLGSRIGVLLKGTSGISFYTKDDESKFNYIDTYNYHYPVLFDVQQYHNVTNNNEQRISFFINFSESYETMLERLRKFINE